MRAGAWWLLPGALASGAACGADGMDDLYLSDIPVVLTASRIQQSPLEAPAPVTVIDRETIEASGFTEIQDLMRLVPGFQVADWYGGTPVVTHHGMGSAYPHNLLVMLDGQSVVDPVKGNVDWTDLPVRVQDIERIEVVRGPNQASYGAGAYNGVINIITRTPGEDAGGVVSLAAGRHDFHDGYVRIGRRGESTDWRMSASDRRLDAFDDDGKLDAEYRKHSFRQTFMANVVHRLDAVQELDVNVGFGSGNDRRGSSNPDNSYPYHDYSIQSQFLELAWRANYSTGSEISLRYAHYGHQQDEAFLIKDPKLPLSGFNSFDVDTSQDSLEFQRVDTYSTALQSVWGLGVMHDAIESAHYFYDQDTVQGTSWQAYGNLDWRPAPDWLIHAGGMVERHYNAGLLFSPRLAVNYAVAPQQSIRFSVGKGYRAPTLVESDAMEAFHIDGVPFPIFGITSPRDVGPEKILYAELGYVGKFEQLGLQVDGRVYTEHYSQYLNGYSCRKGDIPCTQYYYDPLTGTIGTVPTAFSYPLPIGYSRQEYMNGGRVRVNGAELALDWRQRDIGRLRLSFDASEIRAEGMAAAKAAVDVADSAPRYSVSLLWSRPLPWDMNGSVGYYHVEQMKWSGDGDLQRAYDRVDLRLAKSFGKASSGDEIAFTAQGVTGGHAEFRPRSFPLRQAFVTLKLGF